MGIRSGIPFPDLVPSHNLEVVMKRTPRETLIFLGGLFSAACLCKSIEMINKEAHKHETVPVERLGFANAKIDILEHELRVARRLMEKDDIELTQWEGFYEENKKEVDAITERWIEKEKNIPFSDERLSRRTSSPNFWEIEDNPTHERS